MSGADLRRATELVLAAGAKGHQIVALRIDGEPMAKARARVGKGGRHYTPGRTVDAELDIAQHFKAAGTTQTTFPGNIALAAIFYRSNRHRVDVDNLLKTVLDGITKSKSVWADDDQVTALLGIVEYDPDRPRIVVAIGHHESTMLRGDDRLTHTCEACGKRYRPHSERQASRYCSRGCRPGRTDWPGCVDCGGRTSAASAQRCRSCHDANRATATPTDSASAASLGKAAADADTTTQPTLEVLFP